MESGYDADFVHRMCNRPYQTQFQPQPASKQDRKGAQNQKTTILNASH